MAKKTKTLPGSPITRAIYIQNNCTTAQHIKPPSFTRGVTEFTVDRTSPAVPTAGYNLPARRWLYIYVKYARKTVGKFSETLTIPIGTTSNSSFKVVFTAEGFKSSGQTTTDKFKAQDARKSDILFVVDNSCSMGDEQTALGKAFPDFVTRANQLNSDFQIGITTTDVNSTNGAKGALVGTPKILTKTTPNLAQTFARNIQVGTRGSAREQGLEAARLALSAPLVTGANNGFLRAAALLTVVFVSDEDDNGTTSPTTYINFLRGLKPNKADTLLRAATLGPTRGTRYKSVVSNVGGLYRTITTDATILSAFMKNLADLAMSSSTFGLSKAADGATISVKVKGVTVAKSATNGWQYDQNTNSIKFFGTAVPMPGDAVDITYKALACP